MEPDNKVLRDRLLAGSPAMDDLAGYRQNVAALIASNEKRLRRETFLTSLFWVFCATCATLWLWFSAESAGLPRGPFLSCLFFIWGGVEVVKHRINAARLDLLKEIKQVQVQIFALQAEVAGRKDAA